MSHACRPLPRGFSAASALVVSARASAIGLDATAPEMRFQHKIAYVPGGVGNNKHDAMRAMARRFNIRLNMVSVSIGEALSNIGMSVADDRGKLRLYARTEGPLLYMHLPRGHYQITVTYRGMIQTVNVGAGAQPVDAVMRLRTKSGSSEQLLHQHECPHAGVHPTA